MIGIFEVAVALVAAWMGSDEVPGMIETEPIGVSLQSKTLRSVQGRHGVAIGVQHDAAAVGDANGADHAGVGR